MNSILIPDSSCICVYSVSVSIDVEIIERNTSKYIKFKVTLKS